MTTMQRIELALVNLGYAYTRSYECVIKAYKVDDVYDRILIRKGSEKYEIVSDRLFKIHDNSFILENTPTDVIRVLNRICEEE